MLIRVVHTPFYEKLHFTTFPEKSFHIFSSVSAHRWKDVKLRMALLIRPGQLLACIWSAGNMPSSDPQIRQGPLDWVTPTGIPRHHWVRTCSVSELNFHYLRTSHQPISTNSLYQRTFGVEFFHWEKIIVETIRLDERYSPESICPPTTLFLAYFLGSGNKTFW